MARRPDLRTPRLAVAHGLSERARWFRCDVAEADLDAQDDASLAGALRDGASPLKLGPSALPVH